MNSCRGKRLLRAIYESFAYATGFYCSRHMRGNRAEIFGRTAVGAFNSVLKAQSMKELNLDKGAVIYMLSSEPKKYIFLDLIAFNFQLLALRKVDVREIYKWYF